MATASHRLKVYWDMETPIGAIKLAERRTGDMIAFYGHNIRSLPIETLAASCYLQGINDCLQHLDQVKQAAFSDYQI